MTTGSKMGQEEHQALGDKIADGVAANPLTAQGSPRQRDLVRALLAELNGRQPAEELVGETVSRIEPLDLAGSHEFGRDDDQPSFAPPSGYCRCGWAKDARVHAEVPRTQACGESDGANACAIAPGEHDPASNYVDGPVHHVAADGSTWTGPMNAAEAAAAREV